MSCNHYLTSEKHEHANVFLRFLENQLDWDISCIVLLPLYVHVCKYMLTINRSLAPMSTASKKAFSNLWCLEEKIQKYCIEIFEHLTADFDLLIV